MSETAILFSRALHMGLHQLDKRLPVLGRQDEIARNNNARINFAHSHIFIESNVKRWMARTIFACALEVVGAPARQMLTRRPGRERCRAPRYALHSPRQRPA